MTTWYAIVTPVKDEEEYFPKTAAAVLSQDILPKKWIIIDDGSTDGTGDITERLASEYDWIEVIHNPPRNSRRPGGEGVIDQGLRSVDLDTLDYFVRMDGDLSFEPNYFSELFNRFAMDSKLGIASGVTFVPEKGGFTEETAPNFHTRGPLKTYRTKCFEAIGGLENVLGWDTVDDVRANMLGWKTRGFRDLQIVHFRRTQTAMGALKGKRNLGIAAYFAGYHPLFMLARSFWNMKRAPLVFGGISMAMGYFGGYIKGHRQINDPELIGYLRRQQMNRLLRRETIWK